MSKSKNSFIAPIAVLVVICFVASAVLAGVFHITDPMIQQRSAEAASQARTQVLPEGRNFEPYDGELTAGVTDAYIAGNGAGVVCSTSFNGFGGAVKLMIGMDQDGKITGIQVMEQSETPGVGSNALTESYLAGFTGLESSEGVDAWSGATFTSKAVKRGVDAAAAQFAMISGGSGPAKTEEELISEAVLKLIPGIREYINIAVSADGQTVVYSDTNTTGSHAGYAIQTQAKGHHGDIKVVVGIDKDGKVTGIIPVSDTETIGADALKNEAFLGQFAGIAAIDEKAIDAVSGATDTCNAVRACVENALLIFSTLAK